MASFAAEHHFAAAPVVVADGMTDPGFVAGLRLPDVDVPEVLGRTETGDSVMLAARFRFVGSLDPIARRVLSGDRISWVQEVRVEANGQAGTLTVRPDVQPDRMRCSGAYELVTRPDGGTTRRLAGQLSIKVPLIGGRAEQHILPGLLRRIDLEAEALDTWLRDRG